MENKTTMDALKCDDKKNNNLATNLESYLFIKTTIADSNVFIEANTNVLTGTPFELN